MDERNEQLRWQSRTQILINFGGLSGNPLQRDLKNPEKNPERGGGGEVMRWMFERVSIDGTWPESIELLVLLVLLPVLLRWIDVSRVSRRISAAVVNQM